MWPTLSLWSDSEAVTSPEILVELAAMSADVATGTLANHNLTGAHLDQVLAMAAWSSDTLDTVTPEAIMVGRATRDQVKIILAAARKSESAAQKLVYVSSPAAALAVSAADGAGPRLGEVRGHALRYPGYRGYTWHAGQPGYRELLERHVAEYGLSGRTLVAYAVDAATSADQLIELGLRFADVAPSQVDSDDVDVILAATFGNPHVVRAWVEQGSDLARVIAVADHRLDDAFLATLAVQDAAWTELFVERFGLNEAVGQDVIVTSLVAQLGGIFGYDGNGDRLDAFETWYHAVRETIERGTGSSAALRQALATGVSNDAVDEISWNGIGTLLLALDLIGFKPGREDYGDSYGAWDDLGRAALPAHVRHHVANLAPEGTLEDASWANACRYLGLAAEEEVDDRDRETTAADVALSYIEWHERRHGYRCPQAHQIVGRLRTGSQWRTLYTEAFDRNRKATLGELLNEIGEARAAGEPPRYHQVLGNALGLLD